METENEVKPLKNTKLRAKKVPHKKPPTSSKNKRFGLVGGHFSAIFSFEKGRFS